MQGSVLLCPLQSSRPEEGDNVKMNFHMAICKNTNCICAKTAQKRGRTWQRVSSEVKKALP